MLGKQWALTGQTKGKQRATEEETKEVKEIKKETLLENSGVTIEDIKNAFMKTIDIINADENFYFNAALDWSEANGEKKKDWLATIRGFARSDLADPKKTLKTVKRQQSNRNIEPEIY